MPIPKFVTFVQQAEAAKAIIDAAVKEATETEAIQSVRAKFAEVYTPLKRAEIALERSEDTGDND